MDFAIAARGGGGGERVSRYVGVCPAENLPVFKLQRLDCLFYYHGKRGCVNNSKSRGTSQAIKW